MKTWILAVIVVAWGLITLFRHIAEQEERDVARSPGGGAARPQPEGWQQARQDGEPERACGADEEIDYEELERAEEEIRDLGADARPEDGFEGDDWGPGAPRRPPLH